MLGSKPEDEMILLSPRKMETEVAKDGIAPADKAAYLFLAVAGITVFGRFIWLDPGRNIENSVTVAALQVVNVAISVLIAHAGMRKCYATNNNENDFVPRFIFLSIPWSILFSIVYFCCITILSWLKVMMLKNNIQAFPYEFLAASPIITYFYFHKIYSSFRRVASKQ
jgi:hypothetical protein